MAAVGVVMAAAAGIILGLNLFAFTDQSNDDFMIKGRQETMNRDAIRLAELAVAADGSGADETIAVQSERDSDLDIFLIVEDTEGDDIFFNDALLRDMQTVITRIVDDPNYDSICHKPKDAGGKCAAPSCIVDFSTPTRLARFTNTSGDLQPYRHVVPGSSRKSKEDVFLYYVDADAQVRNETRTSIRISVEANVPASTPNRESVIEQQVDATMAQQEASIAGGVAGVEGLRSLFLDRAASKTNLRSNYLRCMFPMGAPLQGFSNPQDRQEEQRDQWNDHAQSFLDDINGKWFFESDRQLRPSVFGLQVLRWGFRVVSLTDMFYAFASIVFVYGYMTFHTGSFFVSSVELLQILCSMPLALLFYKLVYGIDFFQTLHSLSIFIILGIGCDAVFIFVDAWNQAPVDTLAVDEDTLVARMHYTYRRASKALAVTSGTTFAAFMATGSSEIMPIATFGIFSATLVAFNFILDIVFLPAVLVVWERTVRPCERRCCARCCPSCSDSEEDEEAAPKEGGPDAGKAAASPSASGGSAEPAKDDAAALAGGADAKQSMGNPVQEAAAAAAAASAAASDPASAHVVAASKAAGSPRSALSLDQRLDVGAHEAQAARGIERFFRDRCTPAVSFCRYPILVIGFALIGSCAYAASQLKPLSKQEVWFPDSFFIGWAMSVSDEHFGATENDRVVEVKLTWGVSGVDRTGTNPYKPPELGTVVWDPNFTPHTVGAQRLFYTACEELEAGVLSANARFSSVGSCWPRDFEAWLVANNAHYPIDAANSTITGTSSLAGSPAASAVLAPCASPSDQASVFNCALRKYVDNSARGASQRANAALGFTKGSQPVLRLASIVSKTNLQFGQPYDVNKPVLDAWEVYARELAQRGAPHGAGKVIQTAGLSWAWMQTERALVTSAIQGIAIAVSVALVVLIVSTNSIPVGLFATATIGGIVLTVLATMVLLGWELGTTESVSSVILIGFSVDYTVHIANAYQEAGDTHHDGRPKTRYERVRAALAEYGVSIIAGSVTTLLAGLPLFLGTIMFFSRFATLICTSIGASLVWSLTFLPALLLVIGPEHSFGTLSALFQCRCRPKGASPPERQSRAGQAAAAAVQSTPSASGDALAPASSVKVDRPEAVVKPTESTPVTPMQ